MKLAMEGFAYRTSGAFAAFDPFKAKYADLEAGKSYGLPLPECAFLVEEMGERDCRLIFEGLGKRIPMVLAIGEKRMVKAERNILAVEITFSLER